MRASKWIVLLLLAVPFSNGCKGHHKRRYAVYPEPAPCSPVEGGVPVVEGPTMLNHSRSWIVTLCYPNLVTITRIRTITRS